MCLAAVSYTHLDVYKRQQYSSDNFPYIAKIGYDGNYVWGNEVATGVVPTLSLSLIHI